MLRLVAHRSLRPFSLNAHFHCAAALRTDQAATSSPSQPAARKESSVPKGTILKGVNFLKEGTDPLALDDHEYPDWLWDLLDEKKQKQISSKPANRRYHRKQNRDAIKSLNFMKNKKT